MTQAVVLMMTIASPQQRPLSFAQDDREAGAGSRGASIGGGIGAGCSSGDCAFTAEAAWEDGGALWVIHLAFGETLDNPSGSQSQPPQRVSASPCRQQIRHQEKGSTHQVLGQAQKEGQVINLVITAVRDRGVGSGEDGSWVVIYKYKLNRLLRPLCVAAVINQSIFIATREVKYTYIYLSDQT